ncbi:DUF4810 domain-containing protein [Stutzerimonas kirkiae]|uniref:DUF4810 domain-containing protein n=1 Tax=Stutzerimonas kirkiae TaxID=2211392 RepID=A0A4V2KD96_9GAMM|nr:DUF4810 domain-containing protein [Stutzerimonas kirkiae]TBU98141.1 DUF4810 domain-containing protein [Stutzerimonas kirkiae]TBV02344.1 DUF4810 domain-containing protein [Stutzerimonas kirkiae]TBV11193.1 DUF4810 domain-containing protein [Stutzerimonas kirkiae]TBV14655.1 DUF4810 domain-containing protein [Stutzerimonas kirkiae]
MQHLLSSARTALLALLGSLALAGCSGPQTIYQWEGYQAQLNQYFKGESPEAQVEALEAGLEKIKARNGAVPPGYHAQLGLLYSSLGKDDQMIRQFETEKTLFPESTPYMDFLMTNAKGGAQ